MKRASVVAIVALITTAMLAEPAAANYLQTGWVNTYNSGVFCVEQITHLSHSSTYKGGYFRAGVQSSTDIYGANCKYVGGQYASTKAAAQWIYKWNGSSWALCKRNPSSDYSYKENVWRYEYNKGYSSTLCGSGYYTLTTTGWAWYNGSYKGGKLLGLNGYSSQTSHYLPSS